MRRTALSRAHPNLLQTFRLQHAIAEAGVALAIGRGEQERWDWLGRYFPPVDVAVAPFPRRIRATIDHETPVTGVGSVQRPLIFAHAVLDRCLALWSTQRALRLTFAGLITEERRSVLAELSRVFGDDLTLKETRAGRQWPTKAWDESYYAALGDSRFVACPDGDYVWTYRFFEAAMCGAIPVVQTVSPSYAGFRYYTMTDPPTSMHWCEDWAARNAQLARSRLTVPRVELTRAAVGRVRS